MQTQDNSQPLRSARLKGWIAAALIFLGSAAVYAYATGFSFFAFYDDEGFLMVTVQGFLKGHPLYNGVLTFYGPFYYLYEWIVHVPGHLALNHDVTKALCVVNWLLAASVLALAGGFIARSPLTGLFIFTQAVLHLTPLAREPGHPQELVAVLLPAAIWIASRDEQRPWSLSLMGAIAAALLFTKINVGIFFVLALGLALCCHTPALERHRGWFGAALVANSLLPLALMRPHLAQPWAQIYAAQTCVALLAAGAIGFAAAPRREITWTRMLQIAIPFLACAAALVALLAATGSSISAMIANLVIEPRKLGDLFCVQLLVRHNGWSGAIAGIAAAAYLALWQRRDRFQTVLSSAKLIYGVVGCFLLIGYYDSQIGYLLPWSWLLLAGPRRAGAPGEPQSFGRTFLALAAIWESLQAYPTAGTQAVLSTLLPIAVYSVCLHDGFRALMDQAWASRHWRSLQTHSILLGEGLAAAGLLYLFAMHWCMPGAAWRYYKSVPPLDLRGCSLVRLDNEQADDYRALARFVGSESDAFITIPGLNSLYFWTGQEPPTYFNSCAVVSLNRSQQEQVVAALEKARRPLIVMKDRPVAFAVPQGPLPKLIATRCREIKQIGHFRILEIVRPGETRPQDMNPRPPAAAAGAN